MSRLIRSIARAKQFGAPDSIIRITLSREGYAFSDITQGIVEVNRALRVVAQSKKATTYHSFIALVLGLAVTLTGTTGIDQPGNQARTFLNVQAVTFYVATNGNDANPGTLNQPFATLTAARNALAALSAPQKPGSKILVRGGTYAAPTSQLNFNSSVSGSAEYPVVVANYPGEYPVFTGMSEVTVPAGAAGTVNVTLPNSNPVHAVHTSSSRQYQARTPNYGAPNFSQQDPWQGNFARIPASVTANVTGANCPGRGDALNYCEVKYTVGTGVGELPDPSGWVSLTNAKILLFTGGDTVGTVWRSDEIGIESIDTGTQTIRLSAAAGYQLRQGHFFTISGVDELLDAPGEWLQNGSTLSYYRPALSDSITLSILNTTYYQPYVISGSHMVFRGLTFRGFAIDPSGASSWMVRVSGASNIVIDGWEVSKNETSGLLVADGSSAITIKNSRFMDIESQAINIALNVAQMKAFTSSNIVIENNVVQNIGLAGKGAQFGAITANAPGTIVRNNRVTDTARAGIVGGASPNTVIENNVVTRTNLLTADSGAISFVPIWENSTRSWLPQGHTIVNNFVNDTGGYSWDGSIMKFGHYTWGIYLDDFTSGSEIKRNIIKNFGVDCLMNHGGRDNEWENNICYTTRNSSAIARFREDPQVEGYGNTDQKYTEVQNIVALGFNAAAYQAAFPNLSLVLQAPTASQIQVNNTFRRNILVSTAASAPQYFYGKNLNTNNILGDNVIKTTGSDAVVQASINAGGGAFYNTLAAWQATGFDANSVFADPLFVNPSQDNFTVQSGSPALARGFQQINQSLYDAKNVLGEPPSISEVSEVLVGSNIPVDWSIPALGTYPVMLIEYQVRAGSSSGSAVTSWVNVTGQQTTTLASSTVTSPGTYAFCARYTTDIRQPITGSTGAISPEGCRTFSVVSPQSTTTPTSTPTVTTTPTVSPSPSKKPTSSKQTPKPTSSPVVANPTAQIQDQTPSPSPNPSPAEISPVAGRVSPSSSPSASPFATTEPFAVEKKGTEGVVRNIFLGGIVLALISLIVTGIRWLLAVRFLQGKPV